MCSNKDNINSFLFFIISSFMRKIHKNCNEHIHKLIIKIIHELTYEYILQKSGGIMWWKVEKYYWVIPPLYKP